MTYQFGVLWRQRLDNIFTVRHSCSTEGTENEQKRSCRRSHCYYRVLRERQQHCRGWHWSCDKNTLSTDSSSLSSFHTHTKWCATGNTGEEQVSTCSHAHQWHDHADFIYPQSSSTFLCCPWMSTDKMPQLCNCVGLLRCLRGFSGETRPFLCGLFVVTV